MPFTQRMLATALLVGMLGAAPVAQPAAERVVFIHAGAVLDRPGQAPRGASTLVIRNGRIETIRDGHVAPRDGALAGRSEECVRATRADRRPRSTSSHDDDKVRARAEALNRDIEDSLAHRRRQTPGGRSRPIHGPSAT